MPGHHHRSGGLKQTNKRNKRSKASKRSVTRNAGGKVEGRRQSGAALMAQSKADRRNQAQQKRETKRKELLNKKRGMSEGPSPSPRVVGIISLGSSVEIEERVRNFILQNADHVVKRQDNRSVTCRFEVHKKSGNMTVLTANSAFSHGGGEDSAVMAALDMARVCDVLLFVIDANGSRIEDSVTEINIGEDPSVSTSKSSYGIDWSHLVGSRGDRILTAIKSQGLPTPLTVLAQTEPSPLSAQNDDDLMTVQSMKSLRRSCVKRNLDLKRYVSRFATTEFGKGNDRVVEIDIFTPDNEDDDMESETPTFTTKSSEASSAALVRTLCSMSCSAAKWISNVPRSYVVSDTTKYDSATRELSLTGFVRGSVPLDVNSLVHVPGLGTYACKDVRLTQNPLRKNRSLSTMNDDDTKVVTPNPELQESLERFATPDALDGEQNLIGFDEAGEEDDATHKDTNDDTFERPAGWSDYQSSWLDAVDTEGFDDAVDRGELAKQLNQKGSMTASVVPDDDDGMDTEEANEVSEEERRALMQQRRKEQSDDLEFPDEVQVDEDQPASERFARYRSLKSFRKSYWDPKENLPDSYSSIYHISSFKSTQRSVMNDMKEMVRAAEAAKGNFFGASPQTDGMMDDDDDSDDFLEGCVPVGSYVTLTLKQVPQSADRLGSYSLLVGVSLLPHENKVSVLHMGMSRCRRHSEEDNSEEDDETSLVKSKDILTFRCGWRTWQARPVFSQNNLNCDKHKFERFLPPSGAFFAASIFGPVTYTPCPVLVFRKDELVATGTMLGADADRIVVKRIILTGYPVRVHKRHATVKYMFHNPEDVKWFRPAELYTKHGLQGNIVESVGEHGTMKCLFNAPVQQHDTVCLPLYKRIYPKFVQQESDRKQDGMTYRESNSLVVL